MQGVQTMMRWEHYLEAEEELKKGGDKLAALTHAILASVPDAVEAQARFSTPDRAARGDRL
jgi:hypothetical protein